MVHPLSCGSLRSEFGYCQLFEPFFPRRRRAAAATVVRRDALPERCQVKRSASESCDSSSTQSIRLRSVSAISTREPKSSSSAGRAICRWTSPGLSRCIWIVRHTTLNTMRTHSSQRIPGPPACVLRPTIDCWSRPLDRDATRARRPVVPRFAVDDVAIGPARRRCTTIGAGCCRASGITLASLTAARSRLWRQGVSSHVASR